MDWVTTVSRSLPTSETRLEATNSIAPRTTTAQKTVGKEFEAFVMQSFIKEMLPDKAESVFGSGLSGDVYKSMMATALGDALAGRSGIGVAEHIDKAVGIRGEKTP